MSAGGQSTSLKQFPPHPLPPSHSQAPVIITAGRPIVILPNDYIHSSRDFPPGADLSAAFSLQPRSLLGHFHDPTPAPIITPVDDDYTAATTTPAPVVTRIDDDSHHIFPAGQFGGVKAIEFTDNKQCIVPGQSEADPHNKEESVLNTAQDTICDNASKPQQLSAVQRNPSVTEFGVNKLDPVPNNDESANSTTEMPSQNPSSNSPLSLVAESGNKAQSLEQLQLPVQKSSSVRVSPLIMSCYEESKEQLVLDDSDSELEMPECSKSAPCTPQQSAEQSTPESGVEDEVRDSSIGTAPPSEEILDVDGPPPKRAKIAEISTTDSDAHANSDYHCTPSSSSENREDDPQNIVKDSSTVVAESRENLGLAFPYEASPLFADCVTVEAAEPTKASSTLAATFSDHSLKLEYPHEPVGVQVSDGKDTIDQMLPMESAREHAMVPNLIRCADDNQSDDDRDEPNEGGSGSALLKAAVGLHSSHLESLEGVQDDKLVPGQTVVEVEQKMETTVQVPELHRVVPSPCDPLNSADTVISAKPQSDVCFPSLAVPSIGEPARLSAGHQIVPEEFASNTTPSSSQSLYSDHDFHDKCKRSLPLQGEGIVDDELNRSRSLAMSIDSIEKRWNIAASLPRSDDQALPDLGSPSLLIQSQYRDGGSPAGVSDGCGLDEQRGSCGQNVGPFGFQLGKHTPSRQSKLQHCLTMLRVSNRCLFNKDTVFRFYFHLNFYFL